LVIILIFLNTFKCDFNIFYYGHEFFVYAPAIFYGRLFLCFCAFFIFAGGFISYLNKDIISLDMPIIMVLGIEGMFLMISANDFIIAYMALELQSLSLYVLASLK
jgi:NADH:ubiquinone oxidoreductase subunit 2 (subunit N)